MPLDKTRETYRPMEYPWAFELWKKQQQVHWLPDESPLGNDVSDYHFKLNDAERNLITQIFRLFTKSDEEILGCYHKHYMKFFKPVEIQMMLTAFSNMETIHIAAYSHLLDTLGLPEVEYEAFMKYEEMKNKVDWIRSFNPDDAMSVAESLAAFSGATEGMSLFASFAILLNFARNDEAIGKKGVMNGMADIIRWSVRDESMHCEGIARLFHAWKREKATEINEEELAKRVYKVFRDAVANEDAFIDLAFSMGPVSGLTPEEMKHYIRDVADLRLQQLGYKPIYNNNKRALPWLTHMLNGVEFGNFFETRVTEYSKAATTGNWEDAWDEI